MGNKIKVAIAGVGNCASALIQGVYYYKNVKNDDFIPGLIHTNFGGYYPGDIEFVAAFDVDSKKIGKDLSEAIFAGNNVVERFAEVPRLGVKVLPAPILDGVAPHMKEAFSVKEDNYEPVDVAEVLKETDADMLISYVPVGSYEATRYYAQAALDAGVAFINAIPEFIASDPKWGQKFEEKNVPLAGDDIKSQVGATILHRTLVELLKSRGARILETYQLNIGGNTDFLNMTEEARLKSKRISKTEAVTSMLPYEVPTRIGPSDYVPFLKDTKIAYIWLKAEIFGGFPVTIEAKLSVADSPDSAGTIIDVIRGVKIAIDRGIGGVLTSLSAYYFKHPPIQVPDDVARQWVEEFIEGKRKK